jgi:hypothetical protein
MARIASLLGLLLFVGLGAWYYSRSEEKQAGLEVKYRYLVVSIEAPDEWVKRHRFTIQWERKTVELPVAFRIAGPADKFKLGAGPEIMHYLAIGDEEVPVTGTPDTKFRVGNELGFAMIPEKSSRQGAVAFSLVTWVAISPVDQPGQVGPDGNKAEMAEAGNTLAKRLKELIAAGRVIDLQPSR